MPEGGPRWLASVLICTGLGAAVQGGELSQAPQLGKALSAVEVARVDRFVMPDGRGLPRGRGDVATGAKLYAERCAACHGPEGVGGSADELAGGRMALDSESPDKNIGTYWPYATTVFDFISRSMPLTAPGSLSADEVYALTAYLLWRNGIIAEDRVLDARSLAAVVMPNREGFLRQWPEAVTGADRPAGRAGSN